MNAPKLSLVTGAMNRPGSFANLVRSIVEHTVVDWELVVSDASDEPLSCAYPGVRFIEEKPRLGCVKGYNRAFQAALGEFVIFLNDDAEVCPGYDVEAIRFMEAHPQIGLGCLHYSEADKPFHINSAWGVPYANFGILRRELGEKIGWMDDSLTMYGNDNSLTFRVLLADKGVADIPTARIIHHSEKDQVRIDNQVTRARDNRILQDKYMPLRKQWTAAYLKHKLPTSTEPWAHGVRPMVTA